MPNYILTLRSPSHLADSKGEMEIDDERPLDVLVHELVSTGYLRFSDVSRPLGLPERKIDRVIFAHAVESIREAD
jgi:ribosomal protein S10